MVKFSKESTSWKIILEMITGNIVISEVDSLINAVLSKAETTCPTGN
jgi:hypothetical protein